MPPCGVTSFDNLFVDVSFISFGIADRRAEVVYKLINEL